MAPYWGQFDCDCGNTTPHTTTDDCFPPSDRTHRMLLAEVGPNAAMLYLRRAKWRKQHDFVGTARRKSIGLRYALLEQSVANFLARTAVELQDE